MTATNCKTRMSSVWIENKNNLLSTVLDRGRVDKWARLTERIAVWCWVQSSSSHPVLRSRLEPLFWHRRVCTDVLAPTCRHVNRTRTSLEGEDVLLSLSTSFCGTGRRCEAPSMIASRSRQKSKRSADLSTCHRFPRHSISHCFRLHCKKSNRHNINCMHYLISPTKTLNRKNNSVTWSKRLLTILYLN